MVMNQAARGLGLEYLRKGQVVGRNVLQMGTEQVKPEENPRPTALASIHTHRLEEQLWRGKYIRVTSFPLCLLSLLLANNQPKSILYIQALFYDPI